jgi:hypothetical protein
LGTWGSGIFEDDLALDVRDAFEGAVERGQGPEGAAEEVLHEFEDSANDMDEGPVVFLALASLLLDNGVHDHPIISKAREIIASRAGLERWEEAGEADLLERRHVYEQLRARLDGDAPSDGET